MINYALGDKAIKKLQSGFWGDFFDPIFEDSMLDDMSEHIGEKIVFAVKKTFEDGWKRILAVDDNRNWYLLVEDGESKK